MKRILITGASGQLGRELLELRSEFPDLALLPADRVALDIGRQEEVGRFFGRHPVDYCINCAAYTAVDRAESEPDAARRINAHGPAHLAAACRDHGATLLHLSTDYVYHNAVNRPLREDDPTQPRSVYARTKLEGEERARALLESTLVIRTSWVYGAFGNNFVRTMLRLGRERDELRVVYDQIGAPTHARDLGRALLTIIRQIEAGQAALPAAAGVYHYANEGVTSWYDFALAIFELSGIGCRVSPIESRDYPTPARRPHYSVLNKEKIKNTFGLTIPHWRDSLRHCLAALG